MQFVNSHYVPYAPDAWLTFDDVLLLPQSSRFNSRYDKEINLSARYIPQVNIPTPIISAPMDTVTDFEMVQALSNLGGVGILHRYHASDDDRFNKILRIQKELNITPSFAIGLGSKELEFVARVLKEIPIAVLCIDVAHGHMESVYNQIRKLILTHGDKIRIIAGSVCTPPAAIDLINAGVSSLRVGVGGGKVCSTRLVTGHGSPQLTSIMQIRQAINGMKSNCTLIADGGIRNSGDIIKCLAAGADTVMIGGLFAGTDEAPMVKDSNGQLIYRGQASRSFMDTINKNTTPEGVSIAIEPKGSIDKIYDELLGGIRSGLTYSGAGSFKELYEKATFIEITQHAYIEGKPHV